MTEPRVLTQTATLTEKEWLEWRRKGLGGSDIAAACSISRYKTALELWLEKTGQAEPKPAGESAYWGRVFEPIIRVEFEKRTGIQVKTTNVILQHRELDFLLSSVDGILIDPQYGKCIFEAKTANAYAKGEWENNDIPPEYMLQVQEYMAVTGYAAAHVACLVGGQKFIHKVIPRDEETISMIIKLCSHFWFHVLRRVPPEMDGSDAAAKLLDRLYPQSQKTSIILPTDADDLVQEYMAGKEAEEAAKTKKQEAENKLKDMLQEHEQGITPAGSKITWKTVNSSRIDSKKLKADHPEIAAQYNVESSSRRFTVAP